VIDSNDIRETLGQKDLDILILMNRVRALEAALSEAQKQVASLETAMLLGADSSPDGAQGEARPRLRAAALTPGSTPGGQDLTPGPQGGPDADTQRRRHG
jgi:hypothetical protein